MLTASIPLTAYSPVQPDIPSMACFVKQKCAINRTITKIAKKGKFVIKKGSSKQQVPPNPIIAANSANNVDHRDTLDRVAAVLQLLTELNISEGLSPRAESGRYWIQLMLIDSIKYVSDALDNKTVNK